MIVISRVVQRKRPRRSALTVVAAGALLASTILATGALAALVTDTGTVDIMVPDGTQSKNFTFASGANVEYIGDGSSHQSSGTGLFDPFVRIQGSSRTAPTEKGYNTCSQSTCGGDVSQFDTKTGSWTKAIKAAAIPIVDCDGAGSGTATCWELFNDINEGNSAKYISLTKVEVWFTDNARITSYPFSAGGAFNQSLEYQFTGEIKMHDVNSGSGRGDLRYLIPTAGHPFTSSTYFVLYSEWGSLDTAPDGKNFATEGGFEEWKVRKASNVGILKTADAASVNAGSTIGFTVTVTNGGAADATGVTVNDPLPAGTGVDWSIASQSPAGSCSITGTPPSETLACGPLTLASGGGHVTVHITSSTTAASCKQYDNTATITAGGTGSSTASTTVNCGALMILKQSTKAGNPLVSTAGAVFAITGPNSYSNSVTDNSAEDEDATVGEVCVSGLAPGAYTVNETSAPSGYGDASQTDVAVTVSNGSDCGTNEPTATAAVFTNPPLAEVEVLVTDLGSGETHSSIVCAAGATTIDAESENGDADPAFDDTDEVFTGLAPGTYTCTIVVDP